MSRAPPGARWAVGRRAEPSEGGEREDSFREAERRAASALQGAEGATDMQGGWKSAPRFTRGGGE